MEHRLNSDLIRRSGGIISGFEVFLGLAAGRSGRHPGYRQHGKKADIKSATGLTARSHQETESTGNHPDPQAPLQPESRRSWYGGVRSFA